MHSKFLILASLFLVIGCSEKKADETKKISSIADKIAEREKKIDFKKPLVKNEIIPLIDLYQHYADSLPNNEKSPEYLLKASDYYNALGMHPQKIHLYKKIIDKFPKFKDADMVLYLYASALDSDFDERKTAKKYYTEYIEKYPNSPYVNDAKSRLETIDSLSFKQLTDMIIEGANNEKEK